MHGSCSPTCLHLCIPLWSGTFLLIPPNFCKTFVQVTEDEYPYTSGDPWGEGDDQKCKFDARTTEVKLNWRFTDQTKKFVECFCLLTKQAYIQVSATTMGFHTLPHNDQLALMDHLANRGPAHIHLLISDFSIVHMAHTITQDPSPHQWLPQTGVSTMVASLTDVPTTRI